MSEFRFSRGILALAVTLAAPAVARAAGGDAAANSGKARYTKQETEVTAKQTNLTKPEAPPPPKKETGPVLTVDQFVAQKQEGIMKLVDAQISKMRRLIQVTRRRRSPEAGLSVPPRRALRREAALQLRQGARARPEDLRDAAEPARHAAERAEALRGRGAEVAARGGQVVHRAPPSSGSTSAWTRCCSASPSS